MQTICFPSNKNQEWGRVGTFQHVSDTTVDLCWSQQYGRYWLHLYIVEALSSPSF